MDIEFVTGEPAVLIGDVLVISDLHIGIEYKYRKSGIKVPSQSGKLLERIKKLIEETDAKRLVILGDIKHKVPGTTFQEEKDIPVFFQLLSEITKVEVTPGNHDDRIKRLLPEGIKLHPSTGFALDGVWLCHGHAWPASEFLDSEKIIIGHNHAAIELRDKLGYRWKDRAWIKAEFDRKKLSVKYKGIPAKKKLPELILMPTFNDLSGLIPMNKTAREIRKYFVTEGPSPIFRVAKRKKSRVYMLDGTFLGELGKL